MGVNRCESWIATESSTCLVVQMASLWDQDSVLDLAVMIISRASVTRATITDITISPLPQGAG